VAAAAATCGAVPTASTVYDSIWAWIMPLGAALCLVEVDVTDVARLWSSVGPTTIAWAVGAVGVVVGTLVGWWLLGPHLGPHGAKVAAALAASYIGGSINFAATAAALQLPAGPLLAGAMAADNVAMALYLAVISSWPVRGVEARFGDSATNPSLSSPVASAFDSDGRVPRSGGTDTVTSTSTIISSSEKVDRLSGSTAAGSTDSSVSSSEQLQQSGHRGRGFDAVGSGSGYHSSGSISGSGNVALQVAGDADVTAVAAAVVGTDGAAPMAVRPRLWSRTVIAAVPAGGAACLAGRAAAGALGFAGGDLACMAVAATAIAAAASAVAPQLRSPSASHSASPFAGSSRLGSYLMLPFFATIGAAAGSLSALPALGWTFAFIAVQLSVHVAVSLLGGALLRLAPEAVLTGSNANVGGPATAAATASARGWHHMVQPAVLTGSLGYAVGTAVGCAIGAALGA